MSIDDKEKEKKAMEEFQQRVEAQMKSEKIINEFAGKETPEIAEQKVNIIGHLNFGPYCTYIKIDDGLFKGLLERGRKLTTGTANKKLAGLLGDKRNYSTED